LAELSQSSPGRTNLGFTPITGTSWGEST